MNDPVKDVQEERIAALLWRLVEEGNGKILPI